jgi:glutathione synthase/RimK-type ligase-like ATP-grasp enzyme
MHNNLSLREASECDRRVERYNRECRCLTLDREAIRAELLRQPDGADLFRMIVEERPQLFADSPVFIPETSVQRQAQIIAAVERVIALPPYRERVLTYAPETARFVPKARGVFLGYDFHLGADGPRLIEINTNAGGALLNTLLARVQTACCDLAAEGDKPSALGVAGEQDPEQAFLAMFLEEWRLERSEAPLRSIAIVDEKPESQFLYPEFLLFKNLFERNGIDAVICDPDELVFREGILWHGERAIDLVYNRLTDFPLAEETDRDLREAYLDGAVVVTPNPHAHALYADKRNLALLTDETTLREMGVDATTSALLLTGVAHTIGVRGEEADALWAARKRLFFKPAAGYGSKAAYRGDKVTRRVFQEILQGDYVAQTLVPPSERRLTVGDEPAQYKVDLRNYVYDGRVQFIVTRLYQGQTTNFRTPGGGFAPVLVIPCTEGHPSQ